MQQKASEAPFSFAGVVQQVVAGDCWFSAGVGLLSIHMPILTRSCCYCSGSQGLVHILTLLVRFSLSYHVCSPFISINNENELIYSPSYGTLSTVCYADNRFWVSVFTICIQFSLPRNLEIDGDSCNHPAPLDETTLLTSM